MSWAANNEFQVLFANACDLQATKDGLEIPGQLYYSEILRLVPSRWQPLLPFPVVDPAEWYIDVLGLRDSGVGLMFGVVAQAIIGGDWAELVLRGAVLGLVFAGIHRWYAIRSAGFWPTLFYLYLCIWSYYTVRATTFHVLYFVVYRFLPALIVLATARSVLAGLGRGRAGPGEPRGTRPLRPGPATDHA